jgi:hypothetical protein
MNTNIFDLEEKRLEKLPARELSGRLMRLPARQRLETVLQRSDAEAVVAGLAEQDFYYFVKELGPHDALPLLALANVAQLSHLFDLEWWDKDVVVPARAVEWLERLAKASEEKLLAWLYAVDFELLVTLFKKWIRLSIIPEDMDPLEAMDSLPRRTLDDQYYWESRYPQYEDFLRDLLSLIFEVHYGFYKELMNHTLVYQDTELEEEAYRFHRGRLEDRAVPDFYDALGIYQSLRAEEVLPVKTMGSFADLESAAPSFALALLPEGSLLNRALREIRDAALLNGLQFELASLSNKVVVADRVSPDNPEALRRAVEKAAAYVGLGLELRSAGNLEIAVRLLSDVFVEHLFRLGQTPVARLAGLMRKVKEKGWPSRWPEGLKCLDAEWLETAELLLGKTPMLLRPAGEAASSPKEDFFRSKRDLFQGKHLIDVILALDPLFDDLHPRPEHLEPLLWPHGQIRELEDVTLGSMIWTATARLLHDGERVLEPIPVTAWPELFPLVKPEALGKAVRSWVDGLVSDPTQRSLVEAYLNPLLRQYGEEMAPFLHGNPPDPRMVKHFLFTDLFEHQSI